MSPPIPTRPALVARIRQELDAGYPNPKLTLAEVSVLLQFHYRTIKRYADEGVIATENVSTGRRRYVRLSELRQKFPGDLRDLIVSLRTSHTM